MTTKSTPSKHHLSRRTLITVTGATVAGAAACYGLGRFALSPQARPSLPEPPTDKMTYRVHPGSGDRVSLLGYGCMRFPVLREATAPSGPEIDESEVFRSVDYAIAHGVNYFDTSWRYHGGNSEVVIGKALKRHPRNSFFLADKMPGMLKPSLDEAKNMFKTQLERCQVDYFDYYLLHAVSTLPLYQEVYEQNGILAYLLEEKANGRIRNLGWSFHGTEEVMEHLLTQTPPWDFGMVQLNYHDILIEYMPAVIARRNLDGRPAQARWTLEKLVPTKIPLIIMEPLLGGRLARLNQKAVALMQAANPIASPASWAFRYAAQIPNVFTVLSGMTVMDHLRDNIRTYAPFEPLSDKESAVLKSALDIFVTQENIPCTDCGYCMPCTYGVNIPALFTHFNRVADDSRIPRGTGTPEDNRNRRAFLADLDRSVPDIRQAIRCTGCGQCVAHCPQKIDIPQELATLGRKVEHLRTQG